MAYDRRPSFLTAIGLSALVIAPLLFVPFVPPMPPPDQPSENSDVRMRGFLRRTPVAEVLAWVDQQSAGPRETERIPLELSAGRMLAEPIISPVNVPAFARSMMDGYAVKAADIDSASSYNPLPLRILGQSMPGHAFSGEVIAGSTVRIMTGAPLPAGADAVVPAEQTETSAGEVFVHGSVPVAKNVSFPGEDIKQDTVLLTPPRRLRPQDLGALSSIGIGQVPVIRKPRVRLVITGNELLQAGTRPTGHQIADANGPMLAALVERDGGTVVNPGIISDDEASILGALQDDADVIIVSGGSSVGQEDLAPVLLAKHGTLAIHGIAMRPSSPAGMGLMGKRLVFLLPGNPVSCLCAYDFFAGRAIRQLSGRSSAWPYRQAKLPLLRKLVSSIGRVDYARVKVHDGQVEPLAISGAAILSSTTRADGFVVLPPESEGYPAGELVTVYFYDSE